MRIRAWMLANILQPYARKGQRLKADDFLKRETNVHERWQRLAAKVGWSNGG